MFSFLYAMDIISIYQLPGYKKEIVLRDLYLKNDLTASQIAKKFCSTPRSVKYYLHKYGIRKNKNPARSKQNLALGKRLQNGKLVDHKQELRTIKTISDLYLKQQLSTRKIAEILNTLKVPTKRQGKNWDHSTIISVLKKQGVYKLKTKGNKK